MIIDIQYEWLMETSNTLSVLAGNVYKSLPEIENKPIYERIVEGSIFFIFNALAKAQGLDQGFVKQIIYDSDIQKDLMTNVFIKIIEKEFKTIGLYPSSENLTLVADTIQKEIFKFSASRHNIILDSNLEPIKESPRTPEQEQIFQHNNNVDVRDTVIQLQVEFKTGNLIVTDYLHIPELEEIKRAVESGGGSINEMKGRHERTKRLAQKLNIISVSLGDVNPTIFQKEDTLVFGMQKKENTFNNLGSFSSSFWGTSIYEKENVLELLTTKVSADKAQELLNNALKSKDIVELQVTPGFYQVTLGDYFEEFSKDVRDSGLKISSTPNLKPWFVMEKIDLTPKKTKKKTI